MIKIGIIGARSRDTQEDLLKVDTTFLELIYDEEYYKDEIMIISGGAEQGGDRFAEVIAEKNNCHKTIYYPQYHLYGKSAPVLRNTQIAGESDVLIACVDKNSKTGGTWDTIRKFKGIHPNGKLVLVE